MTALPRIDGRALPALRMAGWLALGIVLAAWFEASFAMWLGIAGGGIVLFGIGVWQARGRLVSAQPLLHTLAAGLLVFALGGARYVQHHALPPDHLAHLAEQAEDADGTLIGRIDRAPVAVAYGTRFDLATTHIALNGDTLAAEGRAQITLAQPRFGDAPSYPEVHLGDVVRVTGRLRPPPRKRNPADFDYGAYLKRRGVHALLSTYEAEQVAVLGAAPSLLDRVVGAGRTYVERTLAQTVPTEEGRAVLSALVLGDRSRIDGVTREQFARTGLMHLLAVSGLHVLLVGMVLYGLLRPLLLRLRLERRTIEVARAVLTMLLLTLYMLLTGASASTVRAVIMAGLFIGGIVFQRAAHPLNTLGVAGLILLLLRPAHLFDVGFQLSFAAVAAIILLGRLFERMASRWRARRLLWPVLSSVVVSVAATLGTLPVLLYHFGQASFAGIALNVVAIPCTALTLSGTLLALLFGAVPLLALPFGHAADVFARLLLGIAEVGDQALGWAALRTFVTNPWALMALVGGLLTLALWPQPRARWRLGTGTLACAAVGVWIGVLAERPGLDVIFFDVGQGDAALVTMPNGATLLIDAGLRDPYTDQGARTILPHLERYGLRNLDAVVITHPHSDHLGGLPSLLRSVPVHRVIHNGDTYASDLFAETQHLLDSLDVRQQIVRAGDTLALDPSVRIDVLAPFDDDGPANTNDASVVLRLTYGSTSFLFTGDAEAEAEARLAAIYADGLESDVVKVGHHGSATSSTPPFVEHVTGGSAPRHAVVSVAKRNPFGLPKDEILDRWRRTGAAVHLTRDKGALWLRSDGQDIAERVWK